LVSRFCNDRFGYGYSSHIAPAYGEDDFILGQENKIPVVHVLDEYGKFTETEWKGEDVWEINKTIARNSCMTAGLFGKLNISVTNIRITRELAIVDVSGSPQLVL
jgi:isoleucyl-tRNA synthetase